MEGAKKFLIAKIKQIPHLNSTDIEDFFNNLYLFIQQKFNELLPVETRSETLHKICLSKPKMEGAKEFLTAKINQIPHLNSTNIEDFFNNLYLFILQKFNYSTNIKDSFNNMYLFILQKFNELLPVETRSETLHNWARTFFFVILPVTLLLLCFNWCCCRRKMRAPGRYGQFMPRNSFEGDPRSYFKDLRAKKPLRY